MGDIIQLPLVKGEQKSKYSMDWLDALPVNMLPVAKPVKGANGYMRMWPGLVKKQDVDGVSRGVHWNTVKDMPYRVMGNKLYLDGLSSVADVPNSDRVSMAHSRTSQAVSTGGKLRLYRYEPNDDGDTELVFDNWPETETVPGYTKTIYQATHNPDGDKITLNTDQTNGELTLNITPINGSNVQGAVVTLSEAEWSTGKSQFPPSAGTPYLTNVTVSGAKFPGATLTVNYTFNANGGDVVDISKIEWVQVVPDSVKTNAQYDWGEVGDVCRLRGRYIFAQKGTDTFWVSSIEDESHPDLVAPAYRAESMPDGILAMREWRDYVLCFGSSTIEFFGLTGDANNILRSQPSYMVRMGVAGQFALCDYMDTFAFLSSPARGQASIYVMSPSAGSATEIATYYIKSLIAEYTTEELKSTICERIYFKNHKILLVHLPRHTLAYDAASSDAIGPAWFVLKTGLGNDVYRGIDFMNEGAEITCADKNEAIIGMMTDAVSSQYGDNQELILYTPLIQTENAIISDFEIDANTGSGAIVAHVFVSATEDGINYGQEKTVNYDEPWRWLSRTLWRRVGRVRTQLGFKIRMVGASPATLANCSVRVD